MTRSKRRGPAPARDRAPDPARDRAPDPARPPRTVVFLGPSLPLGEARALLDAEYLPPAAMGDVYRVMARPAHARPQRVALIDGYFERMAAPWHKELLWALERGAEVYGAASMGALRAAELASFGMVGVGQVFEAYRDGVLTDDDEVAVLHGPAERGYAAATEAMVNVRAAVSAARDEGAISASTAEALIALAKAQFYRERSWDGLWSCARAARLPEPELARLASRVAARAPDVKGDDARALLTRLARGERAPAAPRVEVARTWFWWRFVEAVTERRARDHSPHHRG